MNKPDLNALVTEWKPIFGCSDWRITCRYVKELPDSVVARCLPQWEYMQALIEILDPAVVNHDVEETLVHELGHLPFAPFETENGTWQGAMEERAVESIARGMIALKRNKAPAQVHAVARRQIDEKLTSVRTRFKSRKARYRMGFDPVRFGEIMMELGAMADLPDPAKTLIGELAGMAAGGDAPPASDSALKKDPEAIPPPGVAPMFRLSANAQAAEAYAKKRMMTERSLAADSARTKARKDLGALCTPALEKRLAEMVEPDAIDATVAAVLDANGGPAKAREVVKEPTDPATGAPKPKGVYSQRLAARGILGGVS